MGLNIVAHRKVSLSSFAEGWDDCFLTVKVVSEKTRTIWAEEMNAKVKSLDGDKDKDQKLDDYALDFMANQCREVITGGVIVNTDETGKSERYTLKSEDISDVVEFLNYSWKQEIVSTATGTNRLKVSQ